MNLRHPMPRPYEMTREKGSQRPVSDVLTITVRDPAYCATIVGDGLDVSFSPAANFAPSIAEMADAQAFDICEMPLGSLVQALFLGRPLVVLPVVMLRRVPQLYLLTRSGGEFAAQDPRRLAGGRVAVRNYAQTTGVWLRAALHDQAGLDPAELTWVTTAAEPYAECPPPANVERAPETSELVALAESGAVSAVVTTEPSAGGLTTVLAEPERAAAQWLTSTAITPINHVLVSSARSIEKNATAIAEVVSQFRTAALARDASPGWAGGDPVTGRLRNESCFDPNQIARCSARFVEHCVSQGVVGRQVDVGAAIWLP
jgi:4,5-dihydroxyphthalate decarboxylase